MRPNVNKAKVLLINLWFYTMCPSKFWNSLLDSKNAKKSQKKSHSTQLRLHIEWLKTFIENTKNVQFGEFLKTLQSNSVAGQVNFDKTKIDEKCQKWKCDIFGDFETL